MAPSIQFQPASALVGVVIFVIYRFLTSNRWYAFLARRGASRAASNQARDARRVRAELAAFLEEERRERNAQQQRQRVEADERVMLKEADAKSVEAFLADDGEVPRGSPGGEPDCEPDCEPEVVFEGASSVTVAAPASAQQSALGGRALLLFALFAAVAVAASVLLVAQGQEDVPHDGPPAEEFLDDAFVLPDGKDGEALFFDEAPPRDAPLVPSALAELGAQKMADEAPSTAIVPQSPNRASGGNPVVIKLTRTAMEEDGVEDFVRSAYHGTLMVGSPPVPFTVVFDTGSGHLVLPSTYCKTETCRAHQRYRPSASTTGKDIDHDGSLVEDGAARDQISVSFGTGEVTGVFVEDVVCVGEDSENESATGADIDAMLQKGELPAGCVMMRMIAATELSEEPFSSFQFDGILGLGLEGLSQTSEFNYISVISQSVEQWGGNMPKTFAVFLADSDGEGSEIALGGWEPSHLQEDISWGDVPDPEMGHWVLKIKRMRVGDQIINFCEDGCMAAVDTGTSLLAVPTAVFPELFETLKHPTPLHGACNDVGPQLHIEFEEFTVTLGPKEYARAEPVEQRTKRRPRFGEVKTTRTDLRCNPMLMTLDLPAPLGPKLFVLGEPVLRKYYTVYDAHSKKIGFGRAKHRGSTNREQLIMDGALPEGRKTPTMFDVFRWRKANQWRGSR